MRSALSALLGCSCLELVIVVSVALGVPYEALVIFRDFRWIPFAYAVCAPTWEEFRSKRIAWRPPMSDACWVGPRCRHVYSGAVPGLAGAFSAADLLALDDCLPNGIAYVEQDARVMKAEGPRPSYALHRSPQDDLPPRFLAGLSAAQKRKLLGLIPGPPAQSPGGATPTPASPASGAPPSTQPPGLNTSTGLPTPTQWTSLRAVGALLRRGDTPPARPAPAYTPRPGPSPLPPLGPAPASDTDANGIPLVGGQPVSSPLQAYDDLRAMLKVQHLHPAMWNLDRIDQRGLPLDAEFRYSGDESTGTGAGATIYFVDSGVNMTHQEFQPWWGGPSRVTSGHDFVDGDEDASDCDGHGTHIAGTAIGRTVGVAKEARAVSVRVLDCQGAGQISDVVKGLDWVVHHHAKPAIVTLSLGIEVGRWSRALEDTVRVLVRDHGLTVVVASGNSGVDACHVAPADVPEAITVAGADLKDKFQRSVVVAQDGTGSQTESIYEWSNTGKCVDIFAPSVNVFSACGGPSRCALVSNTAYAWSSGTSMAVPHVAGVAAVRLGDRPGDRPEDVKRAILDAATEGMLSSPLMLPQTPNRLLYSRIDLAH